MSASPFDHRLDAIFRGEAQEHVQQMHACLGELDTGDADARRRPLERLFRATHSLKGASRAVGRLEIEALCHNLENLLAGLQRGRLAWSRPLADALHDSARALERALGGDAAATAGLAALLPRLQALDSGQAAAAPAPAPVATPRPVAMPPVAPLAERQESADATMRIPVERLGRLLHEVEELVALRAGRQHLLDDFDAAMGATGAEQERRLHALRRTVDRQHRQLESAVDGLLARLKSALLLPVGSLTTFMQATVRELSRSLGKDVELRVAGGEVEMDRRILQELREPLVHLLRNAIHHGIEPAAARASAGKPARARIEVAVEQRPGGRALIRVSDDGAGIDVARLAQAARDAGLPLPEAADLPSLVFERGLSTAEQLTHVAGRGLGLAIVRDAVERLAGSVTVGSQPGVGTTFTVLLPVSLATFRAVEVRAGGRCFLVPTTHVERCIRYRADDVQVVGGRPTLPLRDQRVPAAELADLLKLPQADANAHGSDCLVLQAGGQRLALVVDAIAGEQEVLSRPVDPRLATVPIVAGAALLAAGETVPVLNAAELVRTGLGNGHSMLRASVAAPGARANPSILIAEDSITSRTLLKNILEVAGYRVDVAANGRQALDMLRAGGYDALVSDVEMPEMDGIALTEAVRADAQLGQLPVVLVTSLASPGDRERGAEAGADAYIVKSSFEQGNLLRSLQELL